MFYLKESITINNKIIFIEASWTNSKLTKDDIMKAFEENRSKLSLYYNGVISQIKECLDAGLDSDECIGKYLGDPNIYVSECGLLISLSYLINNEEGWINLALPSSIKLDACCHSVISYILEKTDGNLFALACTVDENIPTYIYKLIHEAVHDNDSLYISIADKMERINVPFSKLNIAYSGSVTNDDVPYSPKFCMSSFGMTEEEAINFLNNDYSQMLYYNANDSVHYTPFE